MNSIQKVQAGISLKKPSLQARERSSTISVGKYSADIEAALSDLARNKIVARIWQRDYTVWKPRPEEIVDRLGWLDVTGIMSEHLVALEDFASEVREAGYRHVVVLGMGGSSLGAEVLRQSFGSAEGYPELSVLDSTIPATVQAVTGNIDASRTLFLVSSKSGTTTEPNLLYRYFRNVVEKTVGKEKAGQNFIAITDPGTKMVAMAERDGFRRIFRNPPDIGGRYSVLSYFGMVPAALSGINVKQLLAQADKTREGCASCVPDHQNPGAWWGTCMATMAQKGRDKLILITSPSIRGFGLWVEQLIAESTGKENRGIIPVAGEPLVPASSYGDDRLFIYQRLDGDDNQATDAAAEEIRASGQPLVVFRMPDKYELGAEFFRWEFATAIAGAILGIHPFDQPDVQSAKDATERLLKEYVSTHRLPQTSSTVPLADILAGAGKGNYLAIMAYIRQTPDTDTALQDLRRKIVEQYHIATTLGYGPRFLHSTGQLHKGGPASGLFLQITARHEKDLRIPGEPYSFGIVADAQALGDLRALQALGRQVSRIHLDRADADTLRKLNNGVTAYARR